MEQRVQEIDFKHYIFSKEKDQILTIFMRNHVNSFIKKFLSQKFLIICVTNHAIEPFLEESERLQSIFEIEVNFVVFEGLVEEREIDGFAKIGIFVPY